MPCKVSALEGLAELPVGRGDVGGHELAAVAGDGAEGEGLPHHVVGASGVLPDLPPVALQLPPPCLGALDQQPLHIAGPCHVEHQHQKKVGVSVDGEPHPSCLLTRHSGSQHTAHKICQQFFCQILRKEKCGILYCEGF